MKHTLLAAFVSLSALFLACSGGTDDKSDGAGSGEVAADLSADVAVDSIEPESSVEPDLVEDTPAPDGFVYPPPDDLFRVGIAVVETPAPIGIPTAGYGQSYKKDDPHSQFTASFVASTSQQSPITAKAAYLSRGTDELLVVRLDKIGTTAKLLDELTRRLDKNTGRKWDGKVILASNHTHLGPGRLWEDAIGEFANYLYWPPYYDLYVASILDACLTAIADAEPARFGYGKTECPECHNDRRCENPEFLDNTLWVMRFERADGSLKAVWLDFAIHGTVFGYQDKVLSGDAPGNIELKLEETFDSDVPVFLFQSWGGDVSPGDPTVSPVEPVNAAIPSDFDRLERIGYAASTHVLELLPDIETTDDVTFASNTLRIPIDGTIIGYADGEWPFMDNGAMLCGTNQESQCWGEPGDPPKMFGCLPLTPEEAVRQFTLSTFRIGSLFFFTLPGEPHGDYSIELTGKIAEVTGFDDVVLIGYAQDHWGYLMKEYDWFLGGYEPTISAWGPKQADYMAAQLPHVAKKLLDPAYALPWEPLGYREQPLLAGKKYVPMDSKTGIEARVQPAEKVAASEAAVFTWSGGDPWFGTPWVTLQRKDGDSWAPVLRNNTTPFSNRTVWLLTSLEMLPTWNEDKTSTTRDFIWTVTMPAKRNVPTPDELAAGTYRFHVETTVRQGGVDSPATLDSAPFAIE